MSFSPLYQFEHKEFLVALAALPVFILLLLGVLRWKKNTAANIGDAGLVKNITAGFSSRKFIIKSLLTFAAFAMLVLALANIRKPGGSQAINRNGIDVMFALDVSKSMLAEDVKPTRLDRAKQLLAKLTDKLSNNRLGIVVFAGKPYLQMPLTADHSAARMFISSVNTNAASTQGTVIAEALQMCNESFNQKDKKYKAVVLISDGEDHDANAPAVATQLYDAGVVIYTVGIGSPEGAPIIVPETGDYKKDKDGNTIVSKLNEKILKEIAGASDGTYILFKNTEEAAADIATDIAGMEQRNITDKSFLNYKSYFQWFAIAALVLLLAEFIITERRKLKTSMALVFFLVMPFISFGQSDYENIKKGNEAYTKGDYKTAAGFYQLVPETNVTAQYNLGNALYRNNETDAALAAFERALGNAKNIPERVKIFYNMGVVYQKTNRLKECAEAYKNALRLNPADEDARMNLQIALKKLNKEKPKEKKDKKPQQPKEDKNKKQEKPKEGNKQPKPQPARISRQDAEQKLKTLMEKEKALQDKMRRANAGPEKPEKDW